MTKQKIMLIDGNSIINRAFYGLPTLTTKDGIHTNAIYGFLNIFFKLYEEEQPTHIGVAFDLKAPTFRHKQYADYKAGRKSMPTELAEQMPLLKEVLNKMNVQIFQHEGYEADDLMGTLAVKCEQNNMDVVLISGDRDLLQLATPTVKVRIPKTKGGKTEIEDYFEADVIETMGVTPKQYIDVKALMGDASDNIPGVPGIGEKTAFKIIAQFETLDNAIKNYAQIKPARMGEALNNNTDLAIMSKDLATILLEAPVGDVANAITKEDILNQNFREELIRLEFKTLAIKYFAPAPVTQANFASQFKTIKTLADIENLQLQTKETIALSIVTFLDATVGLAIAHGEHSFFVPFAEDGTISDLLTKDDVQKTISNLLPKSVVSLDSKVLLKELGINATFDTSLASYILNTGTTLQEIAEHYLNIQPQTDVDLSGKGKNKKSFTALTQDEQATYGAMHAHVALATMQTMATQIDANEQTNLYYNIELPLAKVLAHMETTGIKIDRMGLVNFDNQISQDIDRLTNEIHSLAEEDFNINSPSQLGVILFEKLGLKGGKKTKTGYSTAADVLEKLKNAHPIVEKVLEYRTLAKLKSTYCEGLLAVTNSQTDKIHTTFNQILTSTGRLSSTEPNLQNIPIRTALGRELRKVFIPTDSTYTFLDADYSQIELRILAHISGDPTMIDAYKNGEDIHRTTAAQVLGIPKEDITDQQRSSAKAINFGIVYGIGGFSLSQDLGITKKEADAYIASYFEKYPKVKEYLDNSIASATETGYGVTIFGRRRAIPELSSGNFIQRGFGERVAMNMPIQGSAADIIKIAMVRVHHKLRTQNLQSRLILTVHDELLIETKKDEVDIVSAILKEEMENSAELSVPLEADVHQGETWFDAK